MNVIEDAKLLIDITSADLLNSVIQIYKTSNENLELLFSNFSVKDKDVLSVLGSGDQAILSYLKGARSIDTFDKEKYTYYCFYLRKWLIKYLNIHFIQIDMNYKKLMELVVPTSQEEAESLLFWKLYFEYTNYTLYENMFSNFDEIDLLSSYDKDIKKIGDLEFKFYNIDICKKVKLTRTYDVVILSNILEWVANRNYSIVRENLEDLLNPGGIAVCSYKMISNKDNIDHKKEVSFITSLNSLEVSEYNGEIKYVLVPPILDNYNIKSSVGYQYRKVV